MSAIAEPPAPGIDDVEPCEHETRDRIITGTVTVLPVLCLLIVAWQVWGEWLGWNDIFVFLIMYVLTGLGITVGFHRMLTHRAFKTTPLVKGVLTALGSAAIEGPVISWVADHRKHHAFADQPATRTARTSTTARAGAARSAAWSTPTSAGCSCTRTAAAAARYAPDLIKDPVVSAIDRRFVLCVAGGLVAPFFLGWAFGGTLRDGLTGMLWGGAVRVLVLHHSTYSINSLCHFFGRRRFDTKDESRNLLWLAPFTFGEAWHNNHHAFPTSAEHGMRRWELDPVGVRDLGAREDRAGLGRRADPARQAGQEVRGGRLSTARCGTRSARPCRSARSASRSGTGPSCPPRRTGTCRCSRCTRRVALGHMLRAPGQLGLGRAYVSGNLSVDDIDKTLALLADYKPAPIDAKAKARIAAAAVRAGALKQRPAPARRRAAPAGHGATRSPATSARSRTTTTSPTTSSRSSSGRR